MNYSWMDEYCLSKKGAVKDFKIEWDAMRYLIGGKMFVLKGRDKNGEAIITLKCNPEIGRVLREQHEHITPGYYMNKEHWNSLYLEGNVPEDILKEMIDMSYELVVSSLSKKFQQSL